MLGKIDISELNTPPEQAEFETAKYFAVLGKVLLLFDLVQYRINTDLIL